MKPENFLYRLLKRTGEWYTIIAILVTQIGASATIVLGIIFEQLNAEYSPDASLLLHRTALLGIPITIIVLGGIALLLSRRIRTQLKVWKNDPDRFSKEERSDAWRDAHTITWKYALSATITSLIFVIIPRSSVLYYSNLVEWDQVIYSLIAGIIVSLAFIPLSTAILDGLLAPIREVLLPEDFEQQLAGRGNLKLLHKNQALVFISLIVAALLIAPIGYHQTVTVLYKEIGSQEVLSDLQTQSVLMSVFAILFASSLAFLVTRSISNPLEQLLRTFQKVEKGNLAVRVPVISSDEVSELAIYFNRMIARLQELQSNLETRVEERTAQLQAINAVGRAATSILDPEELLKRVVKLIAEEFGYYFSAVYLIDSTSRWAELKEATGDIGKTLKNSEYRLELDDSSIIGQAMRSRTATIALVDKGKSIRLDNQFLLHTRSEIALPLNVGDRILGVLDVHSTDKDAFNEDNIETLQNMANQVAISLDNARLFQETRQSLNELRNIQKQYLHEAWIDSNISQSNISIVTGDSVPTDRKNLTDVPIALRDQIIGEITLETNDALSPEDENWIHAIATQAALALENARLLEESQGAAVREKFVTEINNKIWASTTINGVLQTTIRELGQILDATEAIIEINVEEE